MAMQFNKLYFRYRGQIIFVSCKFSKRKTVGIVVYSNKKIEVTAPLGTHFASIQKAINRKSEWIANQLEDFEKYQNMEKTKEYTAGSNIKILGRDYMIKVTQIPKFEEEKIVQEHRTIKVYVYHVKNKKRVHLFIEDWYRNEAMVYLAQKFEQCYEKIKKYNIPKPMYYLRYMKRRWGSCTEKGNILLNPEIFQLPSHCIDYIIMHELCHLKYKNHSSQFYYFLETVLPDWKERAQNLDSFLHA